MSLIYKVQFDVKNDHSPPAFVFQLACITNIKMAANQTFRLKSLLVETLSEQIKIADGVDED